MRVLSLVFLLAVAEVSSLSAQEARVLARATLEPEGTYFVGQRITLRVEALVSTWFLGGLEIKDVDIENAVALRVADRDVSFVEREASETLSGLSRSYAIFPQRAGDYSLPSIRVTVPHADSSAKRADTRVVTQPITFRVVRPPGSERKGYVFSASELKVNQELDRAVAGLKVGDALRRSITIQAEDSVSMLLPPVEFVAPDGVDVYTATPNLSDNQERGQFSARRVESVSYVLSEEGMFTLPPLAFAWWDTSEGRLRETRIGAIELEVAASPSPAEEQIDPFEELDPDTLAAEDNTPSLDPVLLTLALLALAGTAWLVMRLAPVIGKYWQTRRIARAESESAAFAALQQAARAGNAGKTLEALVKWLDRLRPDETLSGFCHEVGDPQLSAQITRLQQVLFAADPGEWDPKSLIARLQEARDTLRRASSPDQAALAPLNPGTE